MTGTSTDTTPRVYTWADGTPYDAQDTAVVERVRDNLLSGRAFALKAASGRSFIGYRPVLDRASWAHCVTTLGRMAAESDAFAQIAAAIVGSVNLYGTRPEASAQVYEAAGRALSKGFDDVVGRSAPDAGRYRDHQHGFTLRQRILLTYWLAEATARFAESVPGVGWAVDALARAENVRVRAHQFPSLHLA